MKLGLDTRTTEIAAPQQKQNDEERRLHEELVKEVFRARPKKKPWWQFWGTVESEQESM